MGRLIKETRSSKNQDLVDDKDFTKEGWWTLFGISMPKVGTVVEFLSPYREEDSKRWKPNKDKFYESFKQSGEISEFNHIKKSNGRLEEIKPWWRWRHPKKQ